MTRAEVARDIINQSPMLAEAYLWTFVAFCVLCLILAIKEHF